MAQDPRPPAQPGTPSALTQTVFAGVNKIMAGPQTPETLEQALRLLAKWRAAMLLNTQRKVVGLQVQSGPFQGMTYLPNASEGATLSRLLGGYEASLHPIIEAIIAKGYARVMDVGCAEGYYAVGLAMRMPQTRILAHDSNPDAREKCAQMAQMNLVQDQIVIGGPVAHDDFAPCAREKTLVICDIEGGEAQLLSPDLAPALAYADILVEVHDCFVPGLSAELTARFAATHQVQTLHRALAPECLPSWMQGLGDLDRVLALWEWRIGPTPWLWMQSKADPDDPPITKSTTLKQDLPQT